MKAQIIFELIIYLFIIFSLIIIVFQFLINANTFIHINDVKTITYLSSAINVINSM
jgi:hypothetical protein